MSIAHLNKTNFDASISTGVVFVDFYADWCGPCKIMSPILEELATEMTDVKFVKVDVDAEMELSQRYGVMSIPTFVVFKDGKQVGGFIGARDKQSTKAEIEKVK